MVARRYPGAPVVGVGGVVVSSRGVLLVKRGRPPSRGLWSIPGGAVEVGESLAAAVAREVAEETGLEVRVGPLLEVVERILRDRRGRVEYHYVLLDYLCFAAPDEPAAGSDAAAARWVEVAELGRWGLTPDTLGVIEKGLARAGGPCERGHKDIDTCG